MSDDFEGPALADFWLPGDHSSGRYAPGAVRLSTRYFDRYAIGKSFASVDLAGFALKKALLAEQWHRQPPSAMSQSAMSQPAATQPRWEPLIGESLAGWTQRGGTANFRVENGVIVGASVPDSPNSFLCTERVFGDFELEFEFKVDPRANSGVQIRSHAVPGVADGRVHGYQVEIDPSPRAWTAGIYDESRRGWLADLKDNGAPSASARVNPASNEPARRAFKPGDWNHVRVLAIGERIQTWLNGVPAADLRDGLTRWGFIALQVHSTRESEPREVRWRNLRVRDLGIPGREAPAGALVLLGRPSPSGGVSGWASPSGLGPANREPADGPATSDPAASLAHWQHIGQPEGEIKWQWRDGGLEVKPGSGSIATRRPFGDCRLHVEFAVPSDSDRENALLTEQGHTARGSQAHGNSGVYIQGRYEVQILDSAGAAPADDGCGAIYKLKAPDYNMALPAGEWQRYDIDFTAARWDAHGRKVANARITVYHNGTRIHDDVEIGQSTGAGQPESPAAAPLMLQDHGNRVRFRNIWIQERG